MLTETEETINEILDLPHDSPVAGKFLRDNPISTSEMGDYEIGYWLGTEAGIDTTLMAREIRSLYFALRLAKAYHNEHLTLREQRHISCPAAIVNYVADDLKDVNQEVLIVVALTTKNSVINKRVIHAEDVEPEAKEVVFKGSIDQIRIHPREIFNFALRSNAASIILLHNHPSGDPEPSAGDIQATQQIVEAGKLLEIPVIDHIVVGDGDYFSMREHLLKPFAKLD